MGIDFVLEQDCPVKNRLSRDGLISLMKNRARADVALQLERKKGSNRAPSDIGMDLIVIGPNGTQEKQSVSVQSLLDTAAPLNELAHHCDRCAASVTNKPFGCYGSIRYPIRSSTEQWILSLLPKDLSTTAGVMLQKCVKDFKYDGAPVMQLRQNPVFFEDRNGHRTEWKGKGLLARFSTPFSMTSSQLLQMMFCMGHLQPSHCLMLCLFLGLVPHDTPPQSLQDRKSFLRIAFKGELPPEVPDLDNFLQFFDAILRSVYLDVPVYIDY